MRVCLVPPNLPMDYRANFGVGMHALIEVPWLTEKVGYEVDPETFVLKNLWTGEESRPLLDLMQQSDQGDPL